MPRKTSNPPPVPTAHPTDAELATMLGPAYPALEVLLRGAPERTAEWRKYSSRSAWLLRVSQRGKPVIYLQPEPGALKATVLLGARAVEAALAGRVSARLHPAIRNAKVYPEGRPVVVRVARASDAARVEELVAVKLKPVAPVARTARRAAPAARAAKAR